jgi:accessory gene regulator B
MFTSIAQHITEVLADNKIIDRTKLDIYVYGYEVLLSGIFSFIVAIIMGLLFSQFLAAVIFVSVFILMRSFTGGYHADTYFKCNLIFAINSAAVMILCKFVTEYPLLYHIIIGIISFSVIAICSPIENIYKPIDGQSKKSHKITSLILLFVLFTLSSLLYAVLPQISLVIDLTVISVVMSMIIEITKKGISNYENCKTKSS